MSPVSDYLFRDSTTNLTECYCKLLVTGWNKQIVKPDILWYECKILTFELYAVVTESMDRFCHDHDCIFLNLVYAVELIIFSESSRLWQITFSERKTVLYWIYASLSVTFLMALLNHLIVFSSTVGTVMRIL